MSMTLAFLLIVFIGNLLLYRSLLNPIVIHTGLWLIYALVFWGNQSYFSVTTEEIFPLIGLSCLGFSLGGVICWVLYKAVLPSISLTAIADAEKSPLIGNLQLFYPFVLLSLLVTLPMLVREVGQFSWGDIQELRNTLVENDGKRFGLYGLIQTISSVYLVLLLTNTAFSIRNACLLLIFLIYTYALGSRGQLILFVIPLVYYLLWKKKVSLAQATIGSFIVIGLLLIITVGRTTNLSWNDVLPMLLTYSTASLPALHLAVIDPMPLFGYHTFRVIWLWVGRIGFSIPVAPVISDWINTPLPTNTYSYLKPYYFDFGMLGVFIFPLILGFGYNLLYYRAIRQHKSSLYLLSFMMYALFMQPIEEQYFRWLTNWLYIIMVITFLEKVEIKWFATSE